MSYGSPKNMRNKAGDVMTPSWECMKYWNSPSYPNVRLQIRLTDLSTHSIPEMFGDSNYSTPLRTNHPMLEKYHEKAMRNAFHASRVPRRWNWRERAKAAPSSAPRSISAVGPVVLFSSLTGNAVLDVGSMNAKSWTSLEWTRWSSQDHRTTTG